MIEVEILSQQAVDNFAALRGAVRRRILRRAQRVSTKPFIQEMRREVPVKGKALRGSIGQKTKFKDGSAYTAIGARKSFSKVIQGKTVQPSKYARVVNQGRQGGKKPGVQYVRRTLDARRQQWFQDMARLLAEDLAKEMAKLPKGAK